MLIASEPSRHHAPAPVPHEEHGACSATVKTYRGRASQLQLQQRIPQLTPSTLTVTLNVLPNEAPPSLTSATTWNDWPGMDCT
jgi:hypothetical protein